jgi:NAD-dependent dihydropyrimidine dehydrogenase PreA subunit
MSDHDPSAARPSRLDPDKVSRASLSPRRVGERCGAAPGAYRPQVDPGRCEGKADCVAVCPHDVFEVGPIEDSVYRALPLGARIKVWAHGKKTAHIPNADACQACGLCVAACPEQAITLVLGC